MWRNTHPAARPVARPPGRLAPHGAEGVIVMGCNCGGRRGATATTLSAGGAAVVWRLYHPSGATVDYWSEPRVQQAQRAVAGSYYEKVDSRTGVKVSA